MALDTGAVLTVIPIETALAIGYDPAKTKERIELVTASGIELVHDSCKLTDFRI